MFWEITEYHAEERAKRIAAYAKMLVKLYRQKHITTK